MPTKIRLQRKGKKAQPFYHIVIADGRAPRDGKYIEKIGTYNPLTKPADINMDFDRALYWLQTGAQPTDTVRTILSYKGVLYKNHLLKGVKKGALTQEMADAKFDAWLKEKEDKIAGKVKETILTQKDEKKKRFEAEKKINEERAKELADRRMEELKKEEEEAKDEAKAKAEAEEKKEEVKIEIEEKAEAEEKKEEVKIEVEAEEKKEEVKEEVKKEAKAEEEVKEEEKKKEEEKPTE
ncbi:MAG: 30S ribosomal protein S16 [Bacteroidetes bacterium]|nr:30S ribosomal protein S16 [Bacteroidota bacterium]